MNFKKVKSGAVVAEFIGTFTLALAILASIWGVVPLIPTPVVAGVTYGLFVLSVGQISGAHINPAVTLGLYSLKKIDTASMISYIVAQFSGAMLAMVTMSMFLEGDLVTRVIVNADYQTFFAEFLGAFIFTFGIASAVYNKYKGVDAALVIGGSLTIGAFLASLGGNGLLNPAVATTVGSLNWSYVLGPILGGIIAMNVFALALTKKGKL